MLKGTPIYLVNASPHEPANPSGMQNLQTLYGLDSLAASVARVDAQGHKILANKLNKTYKKQIIDLGVPGAPDIPKNRFLMDLMMGGAAQRPLEGGYRAFTEDEVREGFSLRPGELHGYVKYRVPSPPIKRARLDSTPSRATPTMSTFPESALATASSRQSAADGRSSARASITSRVPTPSPPATRSTAQVVPPAPLSNDGDESSDDGSRFKELERERKKKLRMKREAELAMGGDQKRRRYDIDGYEFLDSD